MSLVPKKYFHDRLILLILTASAFLAVLGSILILLRLDRGRGDGYIVQYRANLGINAFKTGKVSEIVAFIIFLFLVLIIHIILSMRIYRHQRAYALAILSLGILLLVLTIVVSNALLVLR